MLAFEAKTAKEGELEKTFPTTTTKKKEKEMKKKKKKITKSDARTR